MSARWTSHSYRESSASPLHKIFDVATGNRLATGVRARIVGAVVELPEILEALRDVMAARDAADPRAALADDEAHKRARILLGHHQSLLDEWHAQDKARGFFL